MKRIILLILCVLLTVSFIGCNNKSNESLDYSNNNSWCQIGGTIYYGSYGEGYYVLNTSLDRIGSLCHDPLCTHDSVVSLCMENSNFTLEMVQTDGEKLYFCAYDRRILHEPNITLDDINQHGVYCYDPKTGDITLLVKYGTTSHMTGYLRYYDGYLYYADGSYRTDESSGKKDKSDSGERVRFYRIPTTGGQSELLFDEEFAGGYKIYLDQKNYYLNDPTYYSENRTKVTVINRKTGDRSEISITGEGLYEIFEYNGQTYFVNADETLKRKFESDYEIPFTRYSVWRYAGDKLTKCIGDVCFCALSEGKIIYTKFTDITYYGSYTSDSGEIHDCYMESDGAISVYDIISGETETWQGSGRLYPIGISNGVVIAWRQDPEESYKTSLYIKDHYVKLTLNGDGTMEMTKITKD